MTFRLRLIALGLAGWLTASAIAADDVEVLARGPVHEAYAEPSDENPSPRPSFRSSRPGRSRNCHRTRSRRATTSSGCPGYWHWDEDRKDFIWVSGFWRNAPPGRVWVPGSWREVARRLAVGRRLLAGRDRGSAATGPRSSTCRSRRPRSRCRAGDPAPTETDVYIPGQLGLARAVRVAAGRTGSSTGRAGCGCRPTTAGPPSGTSFVDGYWDYPLADRGVLFAPVYIPPAVYARPGVRLHADLRREASRACSAPVRAAAGSGRYYFGDYFAPTYASLGFTAWCGTRRASPSGSARRLGYDPLLSYYRCGLPADPSGAAAGSTTCTPAGTAGDYLPAAAHAGPAEHGDQQHHQEHEHQQRQREQRDDGVVAEQRGSVRPPQSPAGRRPDPTTVPPGGRLHPRGGRRGGGRPRPNWPPGREPARGRPPRGSPRWTCRADGGTEDGCPQVRRPEVRPGGRGAAARPTPTQPRRRRRLRRSGGRIPGAALGSPKVGPATGGGTALPADQSEASRHSEGSGNRSGTRVAAAG